MRVLLPSAPTCRRQTADDLRKALQDAAAQPGAPVTLPGGKVTKRFTVTARELVIMQDGQCTINLPQGSVIHVGNGCTHVAPAGETKTTLTKLRAQQVCVPRRNGSLSGHRASLVPQVANLHRCVHQLRAGRARQGLCAARLRAAYGEPLVPTCLLALRDHGVVSLMIVPAFFFLLCPGRGAQRLEQPGRQLRHCKSGTFCKYT